VSKYVTYYNTAVSLYKAGWHDITPGMIYGSEFYTSKEQKILERAANDVMDKAYLLAIKHHPNWLFAVKSGASPERCIVAWHNDDPDSKWLDELKHIESEVEA